ncbi:transient receptor potential channel pyrexia-like [Bacillus rossius redtenbacheri]|uniref:transient receptor potential channel pyrexia-like n=1 Tax=Bacillus rossius redtenbacheri TaxID=93214 RepID=UPI002FDE4F25
MGDLQPTRRLAAGAKRHPGRSPYRRYRGPGGLAVGSLRRTMGWRRRSRDSSRQESRGQGDDRSTQGADSRGDPDDDVDAENQANADGNFEALVDAVRRGDVITLRKMFKDNVDVSVLMFDVAHRENPAVLDALLQPENDSRDSTRIRQAVKYNRVNSMRSLLEAGVAEAAPDEFGHTIIQYAVIHNTLESLLAALRHATDREDASVTVVDESSDCDESESVIRVRNQLRRHILQTNFEGRNAFHTAAYLGDLRNLKLLHEACDRDVDLDQADKEGHTPLSLAVRAGYPDCAKFLVRSGASLSRRYPWGQTGMQMLLQDCPRGHEIMEKVLDSSVNEDGRLDFSVLVERDSSATQLEAVFLMFRFARREHWDLLSHPVVECLIATKWSQVAPLFWLRFFAYLLFVGFLSAYVVATTLELDDFLVLTFRIPVIVFSVIVVLLSVLFVSSTPRHLVFRLGSIVLRLAPPICGVAYVLIDDTDATWSDQVGAFVVLFSWLALLTKFEVFPKISHQAYMFIQICCSMFKYLLVFVCLSVGFSLSFFMLMNDHHHFRNPWRAFLFTNLVLLQGEMSSLRLFQEDLHEDVVDSIAVGILCLLFMLLMVIGVLNMLVGLAVRSSDELITDGHIFCQMNKVETLYGLDRFLLRRIFRGCIYTVPRVTNIRYVAVPKKLRLRLQNLRKKHRRHVTDEDNEKVLSRLDDLEARLEQIMATLVAQQRASRSSVKTM